MPQRKIFNDPVHGFISIPQGLVFDLVEHPWFQRLRRIKQLGLTPLVYPGALHTRFHHTLGAMHLMEEAIDVLRLKGHAISHEEALGAIMAILLHDIGHGPFSHALEHSIVSGMPHELISDIFMDRLNTKFNNQLELALAIFRDNYPKRFLHQLVSSQLDVDRLDYLKRDSYFTGVSEGSIGTERIIKMFEVSNDQLVAEAKATYSIENFLVARRLMYWQVYLHKTVLAAENMLVSILKRARWISTRGGDLFTTPSLGRFLKNDYNQQMFLDDPSLLASFASLDDFDIMTSIKVWVDSSDKTLSQLCSDLINRRLWRIKMQDTPIDDLTLNEYLSKVKDRYQVGYEDAPFFIASGVVENRAYDPNFSTINVMLRNGESVDVTKASGRLALQYLAEPTRKFYLCYPKALDHHINTPTF